MKNYSSNDIVLLKNEQEIKKHFGLDIRRLFCKHKGYNVYDNYQYGFTVSWCSNCGYYKIFKLNN